MTHSYSIRWFPRTPPAVLTGWLYEPTNTNAPLFENNNNQFAYFTPSFIIPSSPISFIIFAWLAYLYQWQFYCCRLLNKVYTINTIMELCYIGAIEVAWRAMLLYIRDLSTPVVAVASGVIFEAPQLVFVRSRTRSSSPIYISHSLRVLIRRKSITVRHCFLFLY